jgi:glutathione peroxidase-family protein
LVDDPCVIVLRREDGTVVARFNYNVDPEEIRQTAVEDHQEAPH